MFYREPSAAYPPATSPIYLYIPATPQTRFARHLCTLRWTPGSITLITFQIWLAEERLSKCRVLYCCGDIIYSMYITCMHIYKVIYIMIYVYVRRQCHRADDFGDFTIWSGAYSCHPDRARSRRPVDNLTRAKVPGPISNGSGWPRTTLTDGLLYSPLTLPHNCNNNILNNTLMYVTVAADDDVRKRTRKWKSLLRGLH